jgi:hypothetical protein
MPVQGLIDQNPMATKRLTDFVVLDIEKRWDNRNQTQRKAMVRRMKRCA